MDVTQLLPITSEDIEDLYKEAQSWYDHHWGAPMNPAQSRGMAKDVVRLVLYVRQLEARLINAGK